MALSAGAADNAFEDAPAALFDDYGITRVGDLTGLDAIGIPVWFACRPNSRALSVSQGKGLTQAQARMSAIMEAVEGAVAERSKALARLFGSARAIEARGRRIVPLDSLPRCRFDRLDPERERAWVEGFSAVTGEPVHAPFELVGLDLRSDFPWDRRAFRMSSEGLAAGPDFAFAALAAVLELVENDASALFETLGFPAGAVRPISPVANCHPGLDMALEKLAGADLSARFFDVTGATGIPTVAAFVDRPVLPQGGPGGRISAGFACRFDACEAALAALLEAVQSRLTEIAGARDDLTEADYAVANRAIPQGGNPVALAALQGRAPLPADNSREGLLRAAIDRTVASGAGDLFLFSLSDRPGAHVVRALAPRLEGSADGAVQMLGRRSLARLLAGAPA